MTQSGHLQSVVAFHGTFSQQVQFGSYDGGKNLNAFEFLSVLISVVVGLGIAHLLTGIGRLLHRRGEIRLSGIHLAWTLWVFLFMVIYWWTAVYGYQEWQHWNIVLFLFILAYGVLLFLLCVILYPADVPESWDMHEHFMSMRRWFFGIFVLTIIMEFGDTYLKDHFDDLGPLYVLLVGSWIALAVLGWISTNRRTQSFIVAYHLVTLLAWVGYRLQDLEWSNAA